MRPIKEIFLRFSILLFLACSVPNLTAQSNPEKHPKFTQLVTSFRTLKTLMKQGKHRQALEINNKLIELSVEVFGERHENTAIFKSSLANLYESLDEFKKAIPLQQSSMDILGEDHTHYPGCINNLAKLYIQTAEYQKAKPLLQESLEIYRRTKGRNHSDYSKCLTNLALVYKSMGNYEVAEGYYNQSLEIKRKVSGENTSSYATSLNNLAQLHEAKGSYEAAAPLYSRASEIFQKKYGDSDSRFAVSLNNLAVIYSKMGDFDQAESNYKRAMGVKKKISGPNSISYAKSINNLACLYIKMGRYPQAQKLFSQSLKLVEVNLGKVNPLYAKILSNISLLFAVMGERDNSLSNLLKCIAVDQELITRIFPVCSEEQRIAFMSTFRHRTDQLASLCVTARPGNERALVALFNHMLQRKGLVLESMIKKSGPREHDSTEVKNIITELNRLRRQYANYVFSGSKQGEAGRAVTDIKNIQKQIQLLEIRLIEKNTRYRPVKVSNLDFPDFIKRLPRKTAFIQFVKYQNITPTSVKTGISQDYYLALLASIDSPAPQLIQLGTASEVDNAIRSYRKSILKVASNTNQEFLNKEISEKGELLYKLTWGPIESQLKGLTDIIVCPDGELNFVPFSALPGRDGKYLLEDYDLVRISTGRDLARPSVGRKNKSILAFGAAEFAKEVSMQDILLFTRGGSEEDGLDMNSFFALKEFSSLPGTGVEVKKVAEISREAGFLPESFTGSRATEAKLKKTVSPYVLYLATHGFYLPESEVLNKRYRSGHIKLNEESYNKFNLLKQNPMLRSGLALAGANKTLRGDAVIEGEDGIVTAKEIAALDLAGTNLVVLSACQTALGDHCGGEGVLGLQRAFTMAGAEHLVMTLWSVSDKATCELLTDFFLRYLKTGDSAKSLREAQRSFLRSARLQKSKWINPYYWGAFIHTGIGVPN